MDDEDKKEFLEDFKKGDLQKKLDMWYFALEQENLWDEILSNMSEIATELNLKKSETRVERSMVKK
jgi:hypothetical protein